MLRAKKPGISVWHALCVLMITAEGLHVVRGISTKQGRSVILIELTIIAPNITTLNETQLSNVSSFLAAQAQKGCGAGCFIGIANTMISGVERDPVIRDGFSMQVEIVVESNANLLKIKKTPSFWKKTRWSPNWHRVVPFFSQFSDTGWCFREMCTDRIYAEMVMYRQEKRATTQT